MKVLCRYMFLCTWVFVGLASAAQGASTEVEVSLTQGAPPTGQLCSASGGATILEGTFSFRECIMSGSTTLGSGSGTFSGEARAITQYQFLSPTQPLELSVFAHAEGEVSQDFDGMYEYQSKATDAFIDAITITGGTPGTEGTLQVNLQIDGEVTVTGDAAPDSALLRVTVLSPFDSDDVEFTSPTNISAQMLFEVPYFFDDVPREFRILVEAFAGPFEAIDPSLGNFMGTHTVDFSSTVSLTSVRVKDVPNGTVISDTDFVYPMPSGNSVNSPPPPPPETSPSLGVTFEGSVTPGGTVTATWSGISNPSTKDWIGLYVPGAADAAYIGWMYVSCSKTPGSAKAAGSCPFSVPSSAAPGTYELRLFADNGYTVLATSNTFTVAGGGGGGTTLSVSPGSAAPGGAVTATWSGISNPSTKDWIGLYVADAADKAYIGWIYVSCSKTPGSAKAAGSCPFSVPSSAARGTYELRLFADNGYTLLATSNTFTVTPP